MPPLSVLYRGERFIVVPKSHLAIAGVISWCVRIADAFYLVGSSPDDAGRFFRDRGASAIRSGRPQLIASSRYPLLLRVDRVTVRAWPGFIRRGKGAPTYINPKTGDRVATVKGPVWMFENDFRPESACGTVDPEQSCDDIADLARIWLRSAD